MSISREEAEVIASAAWNAEADSYNQWTELGQDEKDPLINKVIHGQEDAFISRVIALKDRTELQVQFEEEIEKAYPGYFDFYRVPWDDQLQQYFHADTRHTFVGFELMHRLNNKSV